MNDLPPYESNESLAEFLHSSLNNGKTAPPGSAGVDKNVPVVPPLVIDARRRKSRALQQPPPRLAASERSAFSYLPKISERVALWGSLLALFVLLVVTLIISILAYSHRVPSVPEDVASRSYALVADSSWSSRGSSAHGKDHRKKAHVRWEARDNLPNGQVSGEPPPRLVLRRSSSASGAGGSFPVNATLALSAFCSASSSGSSSTPPRIERSRYSYIVVENTTPENVTVELRSVHNEDLMASGIVKANGERKVKLGAGGVTCGLWRVECLGKRLRSNRTVVSIVE